MKRAEVLEAAKKCVCGEREQDYGTPENNFETISQMWSTYLQSAHPELKGALLSNKLTPKDVAVMMALLKIARIATGNSPDSFVDLAGYAACAGEVAEKATRRHNQQCQHCCSMFPDTCTVCPNCGAEA